MCEGMGVFWLSLFMMHRKVDMSVCICTQRCRSHTHKYTQSDFLRQTHTHRLIFYIFFSSIYGKEMAEVLCLVELSNIILSHIGLTSNTCDKPILLPSTESSPCPKITLLSLGTLQRGMLSRGVDSHHWHLQYA